MRKQIRFSRGQPGSRGNPASLQTLPLHLNDLGVHGRGELQIRQHHRSDSATLEWCRKESVVSLRLSDGSYATAHGSPQTARLPYEPVSLISTPHHSTEALQTRLTGPIQFLRKLLEFWDLKTDEIVSMLGFDPPDTGYVTAVLNGFGQFRGRDVRDRIASLYSIRKTLWSLFRDLETENAWLRETHTMLASRSPLELMLSGSMKELILAKEYVGFTAGR